MCGAPGIDKAPPSEKEKLYLDTLVRGVYARENLTAGQQLSPDDYYLAVPLQKGQLSCRELLNDMTLLVNCPKDGALTVDMLDSPYHRFGSLKEMIYRRGL